MNIIKKLISDLEQHIDNPSVRAEIIKDIKTWIERHSDMFNHSKFTTMNGVKIQSWFEYYNKIMTKEYKL